MSVDTATVTVPGTTTTSSRRTASPLRRTTLTSGLVAAAATTAAAAVLDVAGVSFEIEGEVIPLLGYAQMTLLGAVLGGLLLAGLNRWSTQAGRRFVQVAVALTALSCLPSVAMPDDAASQVSLVALHVLAAAIIVPAIARHARS